MNPNTPNIPRHPAPSRHFTWPEESRLPQALTHQPQAPADRSICPPSALAEKTMVRRLNRNQRTGYIGVSISWLDKSRHPDPLDDKARPKALRPLTVISCCSNLHTAADAAVRAGIAIAGVTSIAVLVRPEVYPAILKRLIADAEQKATANLHNVVTMVPIQAQGWLRQSPEEISALNQAAKDASRSCPEEP